MEACERAKINVVDLPKGLRIRATATEVFWFNYTTELVNFEGIELAPAGIYRSKL